MMPAGGRSCCACQSRGSFDNGFAFSPPAALFPFFPPFPMHPQLAAAGFPFPPPGLMPEQFGSDPPRAQTDGSQQRADNGVAAAAALQYQNETLNHMFAHYVETFRSWYIQSLANPPCFETPPPAARPRTPQSPQESPPQSPQQSPPQSPSESTAEPFVTRTKIQAIVIIQRAQNVQIWVKVQGRACN